MSKLLKIGTLVGLFLLCVCIATPTIVDSKANWTTYKSPDGWSVSYPSDMVKDVNDDGSVFLYDSKKAMLITPLDAVDYPFDIMVLAFEITLEDQGTILSESDTFITANGYRAKIIMGAHEELGLVMVVVVEGDNYTYSVLTAFNDLASMSESDLNNEVAEIGSIVATIRG